MKSPSHGLFLLSSFSALAASVLRPPPYDKSTSNHLRLFVFPLANHNLVHKL